MLGPPGFHHPRFALGDLTATRSRQRRHTRALKRMVRRGTPLHQDVSRIYSNVAARRLTSQ